MLEILKYLKARYVSEKAQGIVEYALILAFVVVIAVALFNTSGIEGSIEKIFKNLKTLLDNGANASTTATTTTGGN